MPIYKLNGETYDIPNDVVADFEKDNPGATVTYYANGDEYEIPVNEREGFLTEFPDATTENTTRGPGSTKQPMMDAMRDQNLTPEPAPPPASTPTKEKTGGYKPSAQEMAGFRQTIDNAGYTAGSAADSFSKKAASLQKRQGLNIPKRVNVGETNNLVEGEKKLNPETGKLEDTYITSQGNEYVNKARAENEQRQIDDYDRRMRYATGQAMDDLSSKYINPLVDEALKKADDEWYRSMKESSSVPMGEGMEMFALRRANEKTDPDKILQGLQKTLEEAYKKPEMQEEISRLADSIGMSKGEYLEQIVAPSLAARLENAFSSSQISKNMPKNATEYILQGLSNSIGGMLMGAATETKSQRAYKNQAEAMTEEGRNPYYNPGTGAKLAQMGVSFAADAPFFGLYGKVSGQVAKNMAERQIQNLMAKGLSETAARSIVGTALENSVGARMKNYLMQQVVSSSLTMGGYNATSEAARQMRDSEFDPMRLAGSTAEGLATGAAFGVTGAVSQALSQPLTGISRVGAKAAGFAAEVETMYATEELAKMAQGEEGFTNPFEGSLEAMEKLGVMKVSGGHLLTKAFETGADIYKNGVRQAVSKAMSPKQTGMKLTKEEEAYVRDTAEGRSLMETLSNMHPDAAFSEVNGKKKLTPEGEQMRRQLADNYNAFMGNTEIPAVVKQKVAGVLGGVYRPGLETGADIVHNADGSVILKTRDKDGNCVRDLRFDSFSDAEQWREQCQDEFKLNDAVNMWNGTGQGQRAAVVREIAETNGISAKDAADLVHKALDAKDTSLDRDQYNNVYDVIARNAFPEDEYNPRRRFEEGRKITPEERHFALADTQVKEEQLALYGQEFADEVMAAAEYPDEKMAELAMRKDVTGPMLNAAKEYYNANARMQGMMEEALKGVDEKVEAANAEVRRNTHPDSGMLISGSSRGRNVYVTAGHFQITPEGKLVSTDNSGAVIVRDMNTGEIDVINPNDVLVTGVTDPRRLIEANDSMDGLRGQLMKAADDSIEFAPGTPEVPQEVGETFVGADGKTYMVSTISDENGNMTWAKTEVVPDENGNAAEILGEPQPFDIDEYRKAKSNEIDAANRPQELQQPSTLSPESDQVSDQVTEGQKNGQINQSETPSEEVKQPESQQEVKGKETEQQQSADGSFDKEISAKYRIPLNENAEPDYEKAKPEDSYDALVEEFGEDYATALIKSEISDAQKRIPKPRPAESIAIPNGLTMAEKARLVKQQMDRQKSQQEADRQATEVEQAKIDYWNSVLEIPKKRKAEAERAARLEKMQTPEGRAELLSEAKTTQQRAEIAKEIYGEYFNENVLEPDTPEELVSLLLPYGKLNWEGYERGINHVRGLQEELGSQHTRGLSKDKGTSGFNAYLAKKGEGESLDDIVHDMYIDNANLVGDEHRFTTEEIKDAVINMLLSAEKSTDIRDYTINSRIERAEKAIRGELERDAEAAEFMNHEELITEEPVQTSQEMPFEASTEEAPFHKVSEPQANVPAPADRDKVLVDAVVDKMKEAGIDVSTDWEEGQRVIDEYYGSRELKPMGSTTLNRMTDVANELSGIEMTDQQSVIASVFTGEKDNQIVTFDRDDGSTVKMKFLQGKDTSAGTKHSLYAHYGTTKGVVSANDILRIPDIISKGERKQKGKNVEYTLKDGKTTFTVYAKVKGGTEVFQDFYSSWKVKNKRESASKPSITQDGENTQSAQSNDANALSGAKVQQNPETTKESGENLKQFKTPDGHAYGFTYKGKIYIDPRIATSETPIHEYGHLWAEMKRQTSPEEWDDIKRVMLTDKLVQPILDRVKRDYPELSKDGREDDFIEEVITQFSGKRGAERLREIANEIAAENGGIFGKAEAVTAMQRLKNILNRFWEGVAKMMGWKYRNANQIADRILADMLNDVNPTEKIKTDKVEMKPQKEDTEARNKEYADAVAAGDKEKVDAMLREEAARKGYSEDSSYQGSIAFNGAAPSKNGYFETREERKEAMENGTFEDTFSLGDYAEAGIDANDLEWQLANPRAASAGDQATLESIRNLNAAIKGKTGKVKMYRAVDAAVKENSFRNGDWVTPSRKYAEQHIELQDWKKGRIIEEEVPIDDIWWNGDDINEWGYDDGKGYAYKNTRNNRKLMEPTYDDKGNLIPLGQRFNDRKADMRFQMVGKKGAAEADKADWFPQRTEDMNLAEEMEKAGKDAKAIKMATGWERGADGQWRYEIPDTDADILSKYNKKLEEAKARGIKEPTVITNLEDLLGKDSELFKYYPNLRKMAVMFSNYLPDGTSGLYDGANIVLNAKEARRFEGDDLNNENIYGALLHEIQHAVQDIEGFAKGGSMQTATTKEGIEAIVSKKTEEKERILQEIEAERKILSSEEELDLAAQLDNRTMEDERKHINDEIDELAQTYDNLTAQIDRIREKGVVSMTDAKDLYHRLAGEVESRNVTERMDMTPEERRNSLASETEDVKREDQVIIMDDGTSMNINDIKPVGTGDFGEIYDQFKGKPKEAIAFLLKKKGGEAVGALSHKDIGDIDLVWGEEGTGKSDGFGLAKLAKYHPEVLDNLQEILDDMHVVQRTENRVNLESDTHKAAVRLTWNKEKKNWLLTAFEKKNSALDNTTDTDKTSEGGLRNDTATPQSTVSEGKVTKNIPNDQDNQQKSSPIGKTSSPEAVQAEESRVNTSPTDAQKEAGNYQKGHINVDGYDITIENPKGSVRSGVDSKGNRWESTMHNTYGYIRGTEGVDGDHIDVFLSDNPASGNVYVVDQVNPDTGEFDEHKIVYGYVTEEEARQAYLSNYGEGWKGLGNITEVTREAFRQWIKSSHRKTKPFAEYKSVKANEPRFQRAGSPEPEMTPEERQYWNKWDAAMKKWRERNAIEETSTGPSEKPKMQQGESALDYAKRLVQWNREKSLWQTAPKLEDYRQRREDKDVLEAARENEQRYPDSPSAKMRRVAAEFQQIRRAMSQQKAYDKATVKAVTDFAQEFMRMGFGDNLGRGDVERLLSSVKNATGASDIKKHVDNIMRILTDNYLKNLKAQVNKLASVKELKQTAQGVDKQGKLELKGQRMIQAFREAAGAEFVSDVDDLTRSTAEVDAKVGDLRDRLAKISENMEQGDPSMWEEEYEGVSLALQYFDNIARSQATVTEYKKLREDAVKLYKGSGRDYKAQQELLESYDKAIEDEKISRIGMYGDMINRLQGNITESMKGAREFNEKKRERVKWIHTLAARDMDGIDADTDHEQTWKTRLNNSAIPRLFLGPTATFEQMLKSFGRKNANGEGWLYNEFMRGYIDSVDREQVGREEVYKALDSKVSEIFGKKMRLSDLYGELRNTKKYPEATVEWLTADGEMKKHTLSQGQMLDIYMWNKQPDGAVKLREQGITEEKVTEIKNALDPKLIQLADWFQGELSPKLREKYSKVYERVFGAAMPAVENYFPLRIIGDSITRDIDVTADPNSDNVLPSNTTGAIIRRKVNTKPLDILGTDAVSLMIEHVDNMEKWAAFVEWYEDINALLSYNRFKNQVKNSGSIYGSGDKHWENFRKAAQIAAGTYRPTRSEADKAITTIASGVTGAKIAFRPYTALKQLLSAPAFMSDASAEEFAKCFMNPKNFWHDNIKWAMENLPALRKRWHSRDLGDTRLMDTTGWGYWDTKVRGFMAQYGMAMNGAVDVATCAAGARAIYRTRLERYRKQGMSDEQANKRALQDAEIGYNLTQQSSEGAFVSAVQKDRTLFANMWSVFRNSSMAYTRQSVDAVRNLRHLVKYKGDSIEFMKRQLEAEGLSSEEAQKAAREEYRRAYWHNAVKLAVSAWVLPIFWELGSKVPYLALGSDDEEKKDMVNDVLRKELVSGPGEGLMFGQAVNGLWGAASSRDIYNTYKNEGFGKAAKEGLKQMASQETSPLPLFSDMGRLLMKFSKDEAAGLQDMVNLAVQMGTGLNPQTITDPIVAAVDATRGDLGLAKETELFLLRLLMVPEGSAKNIYIDEVGMTADKAKKLSFDEAAERYARYKTQKGAPFFSWMYDDDGKKKRRDSYVSKFTEDVRKRIDRLNDEELLNTIGRTRNPEEKALLVKMAKKRLNVSDTQEEDGKKPKQDKDWYQKEYSRMMDGNDLREDELLSRKLKGLYEDYNKKHEEAAYKSAVDEMDFYKANKGWKERLDKAKEEVSKRLDWIRDGKYDSKNGRPKKTKDASSKQYDLLYPGKGDLVVGDDKNNEAIMKNIRKWRKEALEILMRAESSK